MNTQIEINGGAQNGASLPPRTGSAPAMPRKMVALEGRLELERIPFHAPIGCKHECKMNLVPWLCGQARTATGATSIIVLEQYLEALNGKYVRITIEAEEQNDSSSATGAENPKL